MPRVFRFANLAIVTISLVCVGDLVALAQSGSRNVPRRGSSRQVAPSSGSSHQTTERAPLALEGRCPVSVVEMRKWVKGDPAHLVVYDGRAYRFAGEQGKQMFQADPAKYVPALGGDCVVALVKTGKRVPGNIRYAALQTGRLFLFSNLDARKTFQEEPAVFANADLALGGSCPVCLTHMKQKVSGKSEIAAFYQGLRYLFPADEQRKTFLTDPGKYAFASVDDRSLRTDTSVRSPSSGPSTRSPARSGSSRR